MRKHLESVDGGGAGGKGRRRAREGKAVDGACIPDPCGDGVEEAREEKRVMEAAVSISITWFSLGADLHIEGW